MRIKVHNMQSPSSGRDVANQFVIETEDGRYFQSYNTVIARIPNSGPVELDRDDWEYSRTTARYRNLFLGCNTDEVRARVKSGRYKLVNLNP